MSQFLVYMLVLHVVTGVSAVACSYAVWMSFLKKKLSFNFLKKSALLSAVLYVLSWLTGGYYYVVHYGKNVKPIIKAGDFPWAHALFTEAKEHLFLLLPFLAITMLLLIKFEQKQLEENEVLLKRVKGLAAVTFLLAAAVTVAGMVISGAVR